MRQGDSHVKTHKSLAWAQICSMKWYSHLDNYLQGLGFTKSEADPNLYYIIVEGEPLILVL